MIPSRSLLVLVVGILLATSSSAKSYLRGQHSNPATPIPNPAFVSAASVGYGDEVVIQSVRANPGENIQTLMRNLDAALRGAKMGLANVIHMDVAVDDMTDWPIVQKLFKDEWGKNTYRGTKLPAMSVLQLANTSNCENAVKVQMTNIVASRRSVFADLPDQVSMDFVSGVAYIDGIVSPSNSNATTYAEDIENIIPVVASKLKEIGMDKHNMVKVSIAMEVNNPIQPAEFENNLIEFNSVYNSLMDGAVLPTMVAYGVNAFPGSERDGLQIQVSVIASRIVEPVTGDAAHQIVAPLPHSDFILPYSGLIASESHLWLSGAGYYGNSTDMQVAATEALDSLQLQLQEAVGLDFDSVVAVDILVSPKSKPQINTLITVYNNYFSGKGKHAPALSLREVAEIGGESPLEVTIAASRGTISCNGQSSLALMSCKGTNRIAGEHGQ